MVTFIMWVALIGVGICTLVFLALFYFIIADVYRAWRFHNSREVLPYPDTSAERMYDVQYFYRANGRTDK